MSARPHRQLLGLLRRPPRRAAARCSTGADPIDVLTGDYLAELTMLILWKARAARSRRRVTHARSSRQMEQVLGTCLDRGVKVVTNAGGLNPRALADRLHELGERLGVHAAASPSSRATTSSTGSPSCSRRASTFTHLDSGVALADAGVKPVTANAYLGGWGIAAALAAGADIVVCGRVTDAAARGRSGRVVARLGARRLGRARRRGRRRPRHRVRAAGHRRQLPVPRRARAGLPRLPDRGGRTPTARP